MTVGAGASGAQQELVRGARALVESMAAAFAAKFPRFSAAELASHGNVGLLEAAARFDPAQETPFEAYARPRIRGAIIDGIRREVPHLQGLGAAFRAASDLFGGPHDDVPPSADEGVAQASLDDLADGLAASLFAAYTTSIARGGENEIAERDHRSRAAAALEASIGELPEREQEFVRMRYVEERDLIDVAQRMRMPYRTAKRYNASVIGRLARGLRRRGVTEAP